MPFSKESILPSSQSQSPFFTNLPLPDAKPINQLVQYFKYWKHFIKAIIGYLKELLLIKEFDANINYQLINSVQFPGFKDLPHRYLSIIDNHTSPVTSGAGTPKNELHKTLSNTSLASSQITAKSTPTTTSPPNDTKRPVLIKTKSNQSFMKANNGHQRNMSMNNLTKASTTSGFVSPPSGTPERTHHHNNDIKIPSNFFPEDSIFNNLAPALINQHYNVHQAQLRFHKELSHRLIPRFETLLKNLSAKIKEIKLTLKNDSFANDIHLKEISQLGKNLNAYMSSVERYMSAKPVFKKGLIDEEGLAEEDEGVLDDPFLLKLSVDYQLKHQLIHENYVFASYVNLQNISRELLTYVLKELNLLLEKIGKLVNNESVYSSSTPHETMIINLLNVLRTKVSTEANHDWEHFISHNTNFVNTYKTTAVSIKKEMRNFNTLVIPYASSVHNKCLRFGKIYKKLKLLKSYNCYYYVLSCNYLHEFRIEQSIHVDGVKTEQEIKKKKKDKIGGFIGHNDIPIKSYNLNDYTIKMKDEKAYKFILTKISNSSRKFTFKCNSTEEFMLWYGDLFELLKFKDQHLERFEYVESKIRLRDKEQQIQLNRTEKTDNSPSKSPEAKEKLNNLRLNLNNLSLNSVKAPNDALSGIFTPRIHTPEGSGDSKNESNPFEKTFFGGLDTKIDGHTSPLRSDFSPLAIDHSAIMVSGPLPHLEEHESYLRAQQELLRQQQDILNLNIKQVEDRKKDRLLFIIPVESGSGSRVSSAESLASLNHQPNVGLTNMLQNKILLTHTDKKPSFSIEDENESLESVSGQAVPTLLVSSDH